MDPLKELNQNISYALIQLTGQIHSMKSVLDSPPSSDIVESMQVKDDAINNLRHTIQDEAHSIISRSDELLKETRNYASAVDTIAGELEEIGDLCVSVAKQVQHLTDYKLFSKFKYDSGLEIIFSALGLVEPALFGHDREKALEICALEEELDLDYGSVIKKVIKKISKQKDAQTLTTILLIFNYLERIGDSLQNIGEAVLASIVGEKLKINQYRSLIAGLSSGHPGKEVNFQIESVGATRSGCLVRKVYDTTDPLNPRWAIFKEGKSFKIKKEMVNLKQWADVRKTLVPSILGYEKGGTNSSLLMEYLNGSNLKHILLNKSFKSLQDALLLFLPRLAKLWKKTMEDEPFTAEFIGQLEQRVDDVYRAHPSYKNVRKKIQNVTVPSFEEMLESAAAIKELQQAPFSVFIHGDLNLDNILYNPVTDRFHFIDVYRSKRYDYVQDISVLIISGYRIDEFSSEVRRKIDWVISEVLAFGERFSEKHGDSTYEARLTLALVRSLVTSTRFQFNEAFSRQMYFKAVYLLEKILEWKRPWIEFKLNREIFN